MKKKCAIVNYWWADGHGAVLTAVALASLVEDSGLTPILIKTTTSISSVECERGRNYLFAKNHVQCTHRNYQTFNDFKDLNNECDVFILGSDQVFRLEWVPDTWFFNAIDYRKNIIAVSASFGINKINNSKSRIKCVSKYLNRFNAISLRERDGLEIYEKYFGKRADLEVVIDPVFLVDKQFYINITNKYVMNVPEEEYIFFYILDKKDMVLELAEKLKKKYSCKIVWENSDMTSEEFLIYIENSKMVITDSFHGSCFSIIYNKPFYCLYNEVRGVSRIDSLKNCFEIKENVFLRYEDLRNYKFDIPYINYEYINQIIERKQKEGKEWIRNSLLNPRTKKHIPHWLDFLNVTMLKNCNKVVGRVLKIKRKFKSL